MSETLHRLVYHSRSRLAGSPAEIDATLETILIASRRNNPRVAVTGVLMISGGCFAQVLEGPSAALERTFERIQQDERHGDLSLLEFAPAPNRSFSQWSMAFIAAQDVHDEAIARMGGFDPLRMTGNAVFETLRRLLVEGE